MFQSPLKTVSEKIKPVQSKSTVASLKFERSSDFKKFIDFIKKETEEIENLKLPKKDDIKPKSKLPNALGILGLAGFAALAALFGGDKKDKKGEKPFVSYAGGAKFALKSKALIGPQRKTIRDILKRRVKDPRVVRVKKIFNKVFSRSKKVLKADLKANPLIASMNNSLIKLLKKKTRLRKNLDRMSSEGVPMSDGLYMDTLIEFEGTKADIRETKKRIKKIKNVFKEKVKFDKKTLGAIKEMIEESKLPTKEGRSALEFLDRARELDPRFKDVEKFVKTMDPLSFNPTKIPSFKIPFFKDRRGFNFRLTPYDALDDFFTGIGESTKTLRGRISNLSKSFMKSKTPTLGLRSILGTGSKAFKFLTSSKVSFAATFLSLFYDSYDAIVNQDDPFTGYYNVFVKYHNKIVKDPAKLRLIKGRVSNRPGLSQEKMDKINLERDRYNQDILRRRNAAENNNQISSVPQNSSGVVPIAQKEQSTPFEITLSPSINSTKFINEKLYKQ